MRFYVARRSAHKVRNLAAIHSVEVREIGSVSSTTTYGTLMKDGAVLPGGKSDVVADDAMLGREFILFETEGDLEFISLLLSNIDPADFILVVPPPTPTVSSILPIQDESAVITEEIVNVEGGVEESVVSGGEEDGAEEVANNKEGATTTEEDVAELAE